MKRKLYTGGGFDIPVKEYDNRIYDSTKYVPKHQTIRLVKD